MSCTQRCLEAWYGMELHLVLPALAPRLSPSIEAIVRAAIVGQNGPSDWAMPYWNTMTRRTQMRANRPQPLYPRPYRMAPQIRLMLRGDMAATAVATSTSVRARSD